MTHNTHEAIRQHYGEVARSNGTCGPGCCSGTAAGSQAVGYTPDELAALPDGADMGLGCGTPLAFARLRLGETVLDLGSGGGIDCFLAAKQVGTTGKVIGVDMTAEMIARARRNAATVGATNIEFRLGEIEHLPLSDRSVDVIVSNCVVNLAPDKSAVFREAFRVLKPGGRLAVSDVVASSPLPDAIQRDRAAWLGCINGAPLIGELHAQLTAAGFVDVVVEVNDRSRSFIADWSPGSGAEDFVAAAAITARRPAGDGCCGAASVVSCC